MHFLKTFESHNHPSMQEFLNLNLKNVEVHIEYCKKRLKLHEPYVIQGFVNEYIEMANRNNQWAGGPLNKEWANKYYKKFGHDSAVIDWKPLFELKLIFDDDSYFIVGFSIISKECAMINYKGIEIVDIEESEGEKFHDGLRYKRFKNKDWSHWTYDEYLEIIQMVFPEFNFNWEGDPNYQY